MVSIEGCKENFKRSQKVTIRYFILCGPFAISYIEDLTRKGY